MIAKPMQEQDIESGLRWAPCATDYSLRCTQLCTIFAASIYSIGEISRHLDVHPNICLAYVERYGSDWAQYMVSANLERNPWTLYRLFRIGAVAYTAYTYAQLYGVKVAEVLADLKAGKPVPRQRTGIHDTRGMSRKSEVSAATLHKHGMVSRVRAIPCPKKGA